VFRGSIHTECRVTRFLDFSVPFLVSEGMYFMMRVCSVMFCCNYLMSSVAMNRVLYINLSNSYLGRSLLEKGGSYSGSFAASILSGSGLGKHEVESLLTDIVLKLFHAMTYVIEVLSCLTLT